MTFFTLPRAMLLALALAPMVMPAAPAAARSASRPAAEADHAGATRAAKATASVGRMRQTSRAATRSRPMATAKSHRAQAVASRRAPARVARIDPRPTGSVSGAGPATTSPYGWLVTVNAKGVLSPKFTGAGSYGFIGYPTLSFRRPGAPVIWSSPDDSISFRAIESDRVAIGPVIAYRGGRYAADAPTLRGVHKPRWTLEGGVFADVWLVPELFRARVELRRGFRDEDGFVAVLGADWVTRVGQWTFAVGPRARLGDGRFMRNQFGVTALDNARNPRFAPHRPGGGLYAVGAYGSATYRIDEKWAATLHGGYDRLTGGAAKSPIVRQEGSRNQWMLGAIVSYTFGW